MKYFWIDTNRKKNQSIQKNKAILKLHCPLQTSRGKVHTTTAVSLTIFFFWFNSPKWTRNASFKRFLDVTQRRTTVGRAPLDKWSGRRRDLYSQQTDIHAPVAFEPTNSAGKGPQTYAVYRKVTETGFPLRRLQQNICVKGTSKSSPKPVYVLHMSCIRICSLFDSKLRAQMFCRSFCYFCGEIFINWYSTV